MKKIFKKTIWFLLIFFALSLSVGTFLLNTNQGLWISFSVISKIIPGKLTAERLDGRLFGPIDAGKVCFENKHVIVSLDKIHVEWQIKELLSKKMSVSMIRSEGIKINVKIDDEARLDLKEVVTDLKKIYLPILLGLEDVEFHKVLVQVGKERPAEIEKVILRSHFIDSDIESLKFELYSKRDKVLIEGSVKEKWELNWDASLANLGLFFHGLKGSLGFVGKIYGERANPEIEANIKSKGFEHDDVSLADLNGDLYIDWSAKKKSQFKLQVNSPKIDEIRFDQLDFSGAITPIKFREAFEFDLKAGAATMFFPIGENIQSIALQEGGIQGGFNRKGLSTKGVLLLKNSNPINFEFKFPRLTSFDSLFNEQKVDGKVAWKTEKLDFLQTVIPKVKNILGVLDTKYTISGTLQDPKIIGDLKLSNASLKIPELNINLKNIELSIENLDDKVNYQGVAYADRGKIDLSGEALLSRGGIDGEVNINGENFLIINTQEYKALVSPQLTLKFGDDLLNLTGDLFVPEAVIKPTDFSGVDSLPREIVYVKKEKKKNKEVKGLNLQANIGVSLGKKVSIGIMGLKGKVEGKLRLIDESKKITKATGNLYIKDGKYDIYGQHLKVTKGELHFLGGDVTSPEVNLEAIRDFKATNVPVSFRSVDQELIVGVRMRGQLSDPKIYLFSVPAGLSNPDILSYLVVGRPSDQVTGNKVALLLRAATALNFGGASEIGGFIGSLRERLGFSEFGFVEEASFGGYRGNGLTKKNSEPGESLATKTSFVLGRFLTPKIYASYSVGLLDEANVFRVKYYINKYFSVQSENSSDGDSGIDLIYTIEH